MNQHNSLIIGYANGFHDPAVAMLYGDDVFAEAFERSSQIKRSVGSPLLTYAARSLAQQFERMGITLDSETDVVLRTSWRFGSRDWLLAAAGMIAQPKLIRRLIAGEGAQIWTLRSLRLFEIQVAQLLAEQRLVSRTSHGALTRVRLEKTPHHLSHAAAAVYTSAFAECAVMVLDGSGETMGSSFYHFENGRFRLLDASSSQHSLGLLYARVTKFCGFSALWGEEWKVMGLAAYGERDERIYRFFANRTRINGLRIRLHFTPACFLELENLCGGFRSKDDPDIMRAALLARSFQEFFADTVAQLARNLSKTGISKNLAYAGGCALNSAANGRLLAASSFEHLHIPCAPADDGTALGAALYEKYSIRRDLRVPELMSPFLGSGVKNSDARSMLQDSGYSFIELPDDEALVSCVADLLIAGNIVAWVQGRAEFGPRALGHRSILADPRTAEMRDRVNRLIKRREDYRPLAPSILQECVSDYFEDSQESPYMERTLVVRKTRVHRVAGVVHQDGTARLQTVSKHANPLYHKLISAFFERSGVPMLLNTSLNVMGKPIVHSMEDALTVFSGTRIDVLVVNRLVAVKKPARPPQDRAETRQPLHLSNLNA